MNYVNLRNQTAAVGVDLRRPSEPSCVPDAGDTFAKRTMDLVIAGSMLIMLAPLMLGLALIIKLTSSGPVFFRQERHGEAGSIFRVWKFRSMYLHAEQGQVTQAQKGDPRVTPIGRFIRRTSLDELPQLFNVLDGTMSLVGPRPHAVAHNLEYAQQIPGYMGRHQVKPGITGFAQVKGFRGETDTLEKMERRVELDLEYIARRSLLADLRILLKTPLALFSDNAY